jgi:hypothetical protein
MAIFHDLSPKLTANGDGTVNLSAGPLTFNNLTKQMLREAFVTRDVQFLLYQILLNFDINNVDPGTLTNAQLKTQIEAMTLKW